MVFDWIWDNPRDGLKAVHISPKVEESVRRKKKKTGKIKSRTRKVSRFSSPWLPCKWGEQKDRSADVAYICK